uniref:Transmembrane protein n=1 Tax=Guillardia theta TaxID=55529 RepID=A0A6U6DFC9_GUITH|mmetsp:Transcript_5673/g.19969  ORF Transcript_5673/g.19969 Transcript_5673/m.19969 type:complete len:264 (+) Transcript_5673:278-1069(+)
MKGAFRRIATFLIGCFALAAGIVILVYSLKEREFVNNFVPKTCKTISVTGRECMNNIIGSYSQAMITAQSCENNVYTQMGCTCQANSCDCSGGTYGEVNTYWWKVLTLVGAISTGLMGLYMLFASYLALSNSAGQVSVRIFSVLSGFLFIIFAAVGAAMIYLSVYIEKDSTFNTDQSCLMKSPAITAEVQAENCIIEVQCKTIKDLKSSMKTILYGDLYRLHLLVAVSFVDRAWDPLLSRRLLLVAGNLCMLLLCHTQRRGSR